MKRRFPVLIHYQITEFLGEGLNSYVYKAFKENSGGTPPYPVAFKVFKSYKSVQEFESRFQKLASVRSKYCASIIGWDVIDSKCVLIMDYIKGISLSELYRESDLSQDLKKEIIAQLQRGLQDLHAAGIIHGDLNPSNVMIDENGQIRIIDFGFWQHTRQNEIIGSPRYLSPARWRGEAPSYNDDIYSLGMVAVDLLENSLCNNDSYDSLRERATSYLNSGPSWFCSSKPYMSRNYVEEYANREGLARRVATILYKRARSKFTTKIMKALETGRQIEQRLLPALFIFMMSFIIPQGLRNTSLYPSESAYLQILTQNWYEIRVDGKALGYTPIKLTRFKAGRHMLQWQSERGIGRKYIELRTNETQILRDYDFK